MKRYLPFFITALCIAVLLITAFALKKSLPKGETETERMQYLASLGWSCKAIPSKTREITVPASFDNVYKNYAALLSEGGFDLAAFKGEKAVVYRYKVLNYPSDGGYMEDVGITLIVAAGEIIGGDISSDALDGFMKPLKAVDDLQVAGNG